MKNLTKITLISLILTTTSTLAAGKSGFLEVEPIAGYERVQKTLPTPHTKDRLVYGIRARFGPPLIALEAEATQGEDTESYPDQDLTIKESAINGKLGIRSTFVNTSFFRSYVRAGGHARQSTIETTTGGVTTERKPSVKVSPYAGAGIGTNLANILRANLGVTAIFTGEPRGSDREYQVTFGLSFGI